MKKIQLLLVCFLFTFSIANAQLTTDDFDSYTPGLFDGQFNTTQWTGWFGGVSNALISTEQAFSGTQSLKAFDDPTGKETDIVALFGTLSTGVDTVKFMQYIAGTGSGSYYNLQHNYTNTTADWAAEVYTGTNPAAAFVQTDGAQFNFTPTLDAWVEQMFIFDFANNQAQFYYGGTLTHTWVLNTNAAGGAGLNTINALNIYAHDNTTGANSLAYYDDMPVFMPPAIDVAIDAVGNPGAYTQLTAEHSVPITLSADILNIGGLDVTNVAVTFDVLDGSGASMFSETVTQASLASGGSATFTTTNTFVPSALGSYSISYDVAITETDVDPTNNSGTWANIVSITDSTIAKDDGIADDGLGFNGGTGELGHLFDFQTQDSISSVSVSFLQLNPAAIGEQHTVHIYNTANGMPTGARIASSSQYTVLDTSSTAVEHVFTFSSPFPVDSGVYFIAVEQEGINNGGVAYSFDLFTANTGFYTTDGGANWTSFVSAGFEVSLLVRPNVTGVTPAVSTNQVQAFDGTFEITPNPTTGFTTLNVETADAQDINVTIFDVTGRLVQSFNDANVTNKKYTVDLSHQPNGVYLVRLMADGQMITKRVVLNK